MSHFYVMVFSRKPEDVPNLMAPYEETSENEKSKWDYWTELEPDSGFPRLKLKLGEKTTQARFTDIDFSRDEVRYEQALEDWKELEDPTAWQQARITYLRNLYDTAEHYADYQSSVVPFAFVTADGEWLEEGTMGWFGASDTTHESLDQYLKKWQEYLLIAERENLLVTLLDCHI